ncbi:MAG: 6-bladed beta-propeller, partial [Tannerella sp.]|nr:6-bladed beta-propeller [Tannerella sp.]
MGNDIAVIDVEQQIGHYQEVAASEIISGLEYIPLQGGKDFLVGNIYQIIVTSTHIFCWGQGGGGGGFLIGPNRTFCYAFDRNGSFLNEIGHVGQGPGEYTTITGMSIDEISQSI